MTMALQQLASGVKEAKKEAEALREEAQDSKHEVEQKEVAIVVVTGILVDALK